MNAKERQALREKHRNCDPGELDLCNWCKEDYPCDVIKVLDAWARADGDLTPEEQEWKDDVEW